MTQNPHGATAHRSEPAEAGGEVAAADETRPSAGLRYEDLSPEDQKMVDSAHRFDLRRIVGWLFLLYGVIVTVVGVLHYGSDKAFASGIAINLWSGLGMLAAGGVFLLWDRARPAPVDEIISQERASEKVDFTPSDDLG